MRKRTALKVGAITCAVALLGSLAACGGDKKPTTTADGKPIVSVLVAKEPNQDKIANMQWAKDLEADCDCKIEWQEVDNGDFANQRNTTLSAGDIPDISLHAFSFVYAEQFSNLFEDLTRILTSCRTSRRSSRRSRTRRSSIPIPRATCTRSPMPTARTMPARASS